MTTNEACIRLVDLLHELAAVKAERDAYRLVAVAGIHHGHDLHLENERLRRQVGALRDELRRYVAAAVDGRRAA